MLPVLTIIGRPNVGKSTLFNYLTQTRAAIVADMPGVTRDRQYGEGSFDERRFIVVDTGGLMEVEDAEMSDHIDLQTAQAIEEATVIFFMVDAKAGLTAADRDIAEILRRRAKTEVKLLVNKADREQGEIVVSEFHELGFGQPVAIAAKTGRGVIDLLSVVMPDNVADTATAEEAATPASLHVAVVGRPNVGKSTLINRMLGEERVVVLDRPGTTRDSIFIPFTRHGQHYTLIDTAGVRRRSKVKAAVEKFSYIKTLQAIGRADVVILVLNAREGINDQDLRLINLVMTEGKAMTIAFNKWDGMSTEDRADFKTKIEIRLPFVDFARRYFISALHGTGVGKLYTAVNESFTAMQQALSTSELTQTLQRAVTQHQPPLVRGRRVRLRYAHVGGRNPLRIVIHGKQTQTIPADYQRYLINFFRKRYQLVGVPLLLNFKSDHNPYVDQ